jgi:hypothetical protein
VEPVDAGVGQQPAAARGRGIPPAAPGGAHAQAQPDQHGPADVTGVDEAPGLGVRGVEDLVVGHPEAHARRRGGRDEFLALLQPDRQRFSTSTCRPALIAASATGKCRWRQADGHGADPGVGDQVAGVPVGRHALGPERLEPFRHGVGHRRQPRRARPADSRRVHLADLTQAYQPDRTHVAHATILRYPLVIMRTEPARTTS